MSEISFNITGTQPVVLFTANNDATSLVDNITLCNTSNLPVTLSLYKNNNTEPNKNFYILKGTALAANRTLIINNIVIELGYSVLAVINQGSVDVTVNSTQ